MIKGIVLNLTGYILSILKRQHAADILEVLLRCYIHKKSPSEALRFLFDLDARLYNLQGNMSVAYGKGIHSKHRHTRYHDFFANMIQDGERVLDIGCGNGAVAYDIAKKRKALITGIDQNRNNIDIAKRNHQHPQIEYICGNALTALPDQTFDVVILSNVLEHLPERSIFLKKLNTVTQPKKILIRVPLFERDWRVPLKKELGVEWRLDKNHKIEYTTEEFLEEISKAGLTLTHKEIHWGELWAEVKAYEP